jgi:hypothetical protein
MMAIQREMKKIILQWKINGREMECGKIAE